MINVHETIVNALQNILPTYYELALHKGVKVPCISYMELSNKADKESVTQGYSRVTYQVKVWANDIATIKEYALEVDKALRPLGLKRDNAVELYDPNSTMIQQVMTFTGLGHELFE